MHRYFFLRKKIKNVNSQNINNVNSQMKIYTKHFYTLLFLVLENFEREALYSFI